MNSIETLTVDHFVRTPVTLQLVAVMQLLPSLEKEQLETLSEVLTEFTGGLGNGK